MHFLLLFLAIFLYECNSFHFQSINSNLINVKTCLYGGKVALTRELGKNEKLKLLLDKDVETIELPCIMFGDGSDLIRLEAEIKLHDIIVITSPQSAKIFINKWIEIGKPNNIKVVTVGKGTSKPLLDAGINVVFEPSDSTAVTLAKELPLNLGNSVLYPTSNLADNKLQEGLEARGFMVTRIETYATIPSIWDDNELFQAKNEIDIVAFGSPSAVRVWAARCGIDYTAVVIGPTSEKEALKHGFQRVVAPSGSKGLLAWANLISKTSHEFHPLL